jgi:tetratricopeptide (TPR) repeat protein
MINITRIFPILLIGIGFWATSCNNKAHNNAALSADKIPLLKEKGDSFYRLKEYAQAIKYYDTLIRIDSLNGEYYFKRGYCEAKTFMFPESTSDYLQAVNLGYRKATAYFNLGLNYAIIDDSIAIEYFEKSLKEDPGNIDATEEINELRKKRQRVKELEELRLKGADNKMTADTAHKTL